MRTSAASRETPKIWHTSRTQRSPTTKRLGIRIAPANVFACHSSRSRDSGRGRGHLIGITVFRHSLLPLKNRAVRTVKVVVADGSDIDCIARKPARSATSRRSGVFVVSRPSQTTQGLRCRPRLFRNLPHGSDRLVFPRLRRLFPPRELSGQTAVLANIPFEHHTSQSWASKNRVIVSSSSDRDMRDTELPFSGLGPGFVIDIGGQGCRF